MLEYLDSGSFQNQAQHTYQVLSMFAEQPDSVFVTVPSFSLKLV